jgi:CRP-like cAMP-binding protein
MIDNLRDQIQKRIDELVEEADRLRAALGALGGGTARSTTTRRAPARNGRRRATRTSSRQSTASASPARATRRTTSTSRRRSTAGGTKASVLAALQSGEAMTASQVAQQTGLGRASVSTTLSKLAKSGEVRKAQRGYQLAGGGNSSRAANGAKTAA